MAVFHAIDVGALKTRPLFDIALGELLCFTDGADAVGYEHDGFSHGFRGPPVRERGRSWILHEIGVSKNGIGRSGKWLGEEGFGSVDV